MTDLDQRQHTRSVEGDRRTVVVGLLADPDTPAEVAAKLVDTLPDVLAAQVDDEITWDVRTMTSHCSCTGSSWMSPRTA
jgi:hypothetical protein